MKSLFFLILFSFLTLAQTFASVACESLFKYGLTEGQITQVIQELHGLRKMALNSRGTKYQISKGLYYKKLKEVTQQIPAAEIEEKLRQIKSNEVIPSDEKKIEKTTSAAVDVERLLETDVVANHLIEVIQNKNSYLDPTNPNSDRILKFLREANETEYAQLLFLVNQSGIDLNRKLAGGSHRVLHISMSMEQPEVAEFLIRAGADINVTNEYGNTPLESYNGNDIRIVEVFLQHGASVFTKNIAHGTLIKWADVHGYSKNLEVYIQTQKSLAGHSKLFHKI
jgi:hypothetical protein